jgi:uncharacterized membrane protein
VLGDLLRAVAHLFAYPGAQHLQNIHPLIVHFPIALLLAAALVYWLAFIVGRESWQWSGLWMLALGAIGAAAAVASGLYAASGVMLAPSVKTALLIAHKRIMIAASILSAALTLWAMRGRAAFLAMLVLVAILIAKGADYGGRMVYDYNAGGYACGQPIEFSQ